MVVLEEEEEKEQEQEQQQEQELQSERNNIISISAHYVWCSQYTI